MYVCICVYRQACSFARFGKYVFFSHDCIYMIRRFYALWLNLSESHISFSLGTETREIHSFIYSIARSFEHNYPFRLLCNNIVHVQECYIIPKEDVTLFFAFHRHDRRDDVAKNCARCRSRDTHFSLFSHLSANH